MSSAPSASTVARLALASDARRVAAQENAQAQAALVGNTDDVGRVEQATIVLKEMEKKKKEINDALAALYAQYRTFLCQSTSKPAVLPTDAITSLRHDLTTIHTYLTSLHTYITHHSHLLSLFDIRQSTLMITLLRERIDEAYDTVLPKQTFRFRQRRKKSSDPKPTSAPIITPALITLPTSTPTAAPQARTHELSITNKENTTILLANPTHADVFIAYCKDATIHIPDVSGAVRIHDVSHCDIYLGPISGSAHIEHVNNSTITLASRQLRIHTTTDTTFYVDVQSGPIIEHTTRVSFAPYHYIYPMYQQHMQEAHLQGPSQWDRVEDFNWLRTQHSPNWDVVPEEKRASSVTPPLIEQS